MTAPEDPSPYEDDRRSLWVSVDVPRRLPATAVVAVMRAAHDVVIAPSLAVGRLRTSLLAHAVGADLGRARPVPGLAWDDAARHEPLEGVHAQGVLPPGVSLPARHGGRVFNIDAEFPIDASWADGTRFETPLIVGFSVVQGALTGGSAGESAQQAARDWLVETVDRLDAATGFATVDFAGSFATNESPYEAAAEVIRVTVDPARQVRGYHWLTVLGPGHAALLGGPEVVEAAPVEEVERLSGGRFLLRLTRDARTIDASQLAALRSFLGPLLPVGLGSVEEYQAPSASRFDIRVPYRL